MLSNIDKLPSLECVPLGDRSSVSIAVISTNADKSLGEFALNSQI